MAKTGCPPRASVGVSVDYVERRVSEMIMATEKGATVPTPLHSPRSKRAIVKLYFDILLEAAAYNKTAAVALTKRSV